MIAAAPDRCHALPVLGGPKENLVLRCRDWPGLQCVDALVEGKPLEGYWRDRSLEYEARRRGKEVDPETFIKRYTLKLDPLPCWRHLPEEDIRRRLQCPPPCHRPSGLGYWPASSRKGEPAHSLSSPASRSRDTPEPCLHARHTKQPVPNACLSARRTNVTAATLITVINPQCVTVATLVNVIDDRIGPFPTPV